MWLPLSRCFFLTGCAGQPTPGSTAGEQTTASVATPPAASTPAATSSSVTGAVPQTLTFTARTVDGTQFDAASLAGKPVVLWFWAAWCPRCRRRRGRPTRITPTGSMWSGVAGLNSGQDAMREFVADRGIGGFVNLADDEGRIWRRCGVTTQEHYLLDSSGTVVHKGPLSSDALRDRVTALAG
ncbi:redoxin domain-containing protein [Micromonospora sp. CPCC 205371]|nr:redoxin domain-containing protein [Micromonospora sp. CPCC 205371]